MAMMMGFGREPYALIYAPVQAGKGVA